ncbi:3-oxoacid CoA-transferase subunit B [Chloroflexota bacterium]
MKERLDRHTIAARVAKEFQDGDVVNLGIGMGTLAVNYVPEGRQVILHSENGIFGYGEVLAEGEEELMDFNLVNAAGEFVSPLPGMSIGTFADAFDAVRTGRVSISVLGAFEVSERGDLANVSIEGGEKVATIGGAMDIALGVKKVIAAMSHTTNEGKPKIVKKCRLPLTARECVDLIVTDIAVIEVTGNGLLLKEMAPRWTVEEIQALTEPGLIIAPALKEIEL